MATKATVLKDKDGTSLYPVTDVSLVVGLQEGAIMESVVVSELPTADATTVGKIYMIPSATVTGEYDRYMTTYSNSAYTWTQLGSTAIPSPVIADNLTTNDATQALSAKQGKVLNDNMTQLGQKVTDFYLPILSEKTVSLGGTIGATINLTPQSEVGWSCVVVVCSEGDSFTINGRGGSSTRLWGFVDSENKLIAVSASALTGTNLKVIAPANSAYFVSNANGSLSVLYRKYGSLPDVESRLSKEIEQFIPGESKNLFDKTQGYINGYVNSQGKIISNADSLVVKVELKTNTEYSIGFTEAHSSWTGFFLAAQDENGNNLNVTAGGTSSVFKDYGSSKKTTFQVANSAAYFFLIVTVKNASYDLRGELMLFLGSEIPTTYIPYSFQIPSGKFDATGLVKESDLATIESILTDHLEEKGEDATITNGGYVKTDGTISSSSGWSYATLPVSPTQKYTITAIAGQLARLWFFLDSNGDVLQYSSDSSTIGLKTETVVIPEGCVTLEVNARKDNGDPLPSIKLHETGVDGEKVYIGTENITEYIERIISGGDNVVSLNFTTGGESYIISPFNDTYNIKTRFVLSRPASLNENTNFNFLGVSLMDKATGVETSVHGCNDDICPANYNSIYIGGNHADSDVREVVCAGHGKTYEDIGSVWQSSGGGKYTIVAIIDEDTLWMLGDNYLTYPLFRFTGPVADITLTHFSGATHTDSIAITASTTKQWHSATRISDLSVYLDGFKVTESGTYGFKKLSVCENYDVLNPASVLDIIKAGAGTFTENPNPSSFANADKVVRHSIVYGFKSAAEWTIATDFIAYQNISIGYFGFTQMYYLSGSNRKLYMPKALPNGGKDFRQIEDFTSLSSALAFTSEYWENPVLPPDRYLQFTDSIGVHTGFLFDYGVGGNNRKDFVNNAITLNNTLKIYPRGIDSKVTVSAGDTFSAVVWRSYLDRAKINTGGIIATDVVEYAGKCYVYADFNAVGIYEVAIPGDFVGRDFSIFEKSANVTVLSGLSNGEVLVKVETASPVYGYLVMQIK